MAERLVVVKKLADTPYPPVSIETHMGLCPCVSPQKTSSLQSLLSTYVVPAPDKVAMGDVVILSMLR
jgi:hypothetical protein